MMHKKVFVVNPRYTLLNDRNRAVIMTNDLLIDKPEEFTEDFRSFIHPLHAQLFAFFDGERTYEEVLNEVHKCYGLNTEETENFLSRCLENPQKFHIILEKQRIFFPAYLLIPRENASFFKVYDPTDFLVHEKVDIKSKRFNISRHYLFVLNTTCKTDCIYCYADKQTKFNHPLSTARIIELIDQATQLGALSIDCNGGEVLLHPDHMEIIGHLISRGYQPQISTKCPLTEQKIKQLKDLGLKQLQISLDSTDPHVLQTMLNVNSNYYHKLFQTILWLDKYNFQTTIHVILTRYNDTMESVSQIIEQFAPYKNVSIRFDPAGFSLFKQEEFTKLRTSERKFRLLQDTVEHYEQRYPGKIEIGDFGEFQSNFANSTAKENRYSSREVCGGNVWSLIILPDGKVTICEELYWHPSFILSDLSKQEILDVWNSEKAVSLLNFTQNEISPDSPCKTCTDFITCRTLRGHGHICWKEVQYFYGREKWDYPIPSCKWAPAPFNENLIPRD
ncbi:MAG: radical SAM protein [Rikenellaceae bacterium]|nr:radical SAM protein [Rikenellaceae bacterium]